MLDPSAFGSGGPVATTFGSASDFANGAVLRAQAEVSSSPALASRAGVGPSAWLHSVEGCPTAGWNPSLGSGRESDATDGGGERERPGRSRSSSMGG